MRGDLQDREAVVVRLETADEQVVAVEQQVLDLMLASNIMLLTSGYR